MHKKIGTEQIQWPHGEFFAYANISTKSKSFLKIFIQIKILLVTVTVRKKLPIEANYFYAFCLNTVMKATPVPTKINNSYEWVEFL